MVEIVPHVDSRAPCGWWRTQDGEVMLACPKCGQAGSLADHQVAPDGSVSPSVECPQANCFHGYVVLQEYQP